MFLVCLVFQHDCQEFLALLLDTLHEQLNRGSANRKSLDLTEDQSEIKKLKRAISQNCSDSAVVEDGSKMDVTSTDYDTVTVTAPCRESKPDVDVDPTPFVQSPMIGEDSNQSEPSNANQDALASHRLEPLPGSIKPFKITNVTSDPGENSADIAQDIPPGVSIRNDAVVSEAGMTGSTTSASRCEDQILQESSEEPNLIRDDISTDAEERKLPSLEDLYMKDTKTLNTNVLASEFLHEEVTLDSEKFHKQDNTEMPQEEDFSLNHLNDLLSVDPAKGDEVKPFKESNLLANVHDKFSEDDGFGKKCLFSDLEEMGRDGASMPGCSDYNINNSKRMKTDEEEKNQRMQAKLNVHTDKNLMKETNMEVAAAADFGLCLSPIYNRDGIGDCMLKDGQASCSPLAQGDQLLIQTHHSPRGIPFVDNRASNVQTWISHAREAEQSWERYLQRNQSVIVSTFQGQFKSTVRMNCNMCIMLLNV